MFILGSFRINRMHDSESETFVIKSMPEKFSDILDSIGVSSTPKEIATDDVENDDYYSRVFSNNKNDH